jgi:hypothetical protein
VLPRARFALGTPAMPPIAPFAHYRSPFLYARGALHRQSKPSIFVPHEGRLPLGSQHDRRYPLVRLALPRVAGRLQLTSPKRGLTGSLVVCAHP